MGSFLVSCCATNQTINEFEGVYVIPIFENLTQVENKEQLPLQGLDRLTYNTDLYGLLGFIFSGHYDDYGQYMIDWDKPSNKYMLEKYLNFLKEEAVYIEQGENKYHDLAFNPIDLEVDGTNYQAIWDYIHEVIWEGRLFLRRSNYQGGYLYTKVEYFIAHKENMDILLDMYKERDTSNGYYSSAEEKNFYRETVDKKALLMFEQFKEEIELEASEENALALLEKRLRNNNYIYHFFGESVGSSSNVLWRPFEKRRKELVEQHLDNYQDYLEIYKAFVTMKDIVVSLSYCNVIIRPVYYASQDYGNTFGNRFSIWMSKVLEKNIQNADLEYLLEDEEELTNKDVRDLLEKNAKSFIY